MVERHVRLDPVKFGTHPLLVERRQCLEDKAPYAVLFVGVGGFRNGISRPVLQCDSGDCIATGPVVGVTKAGVVSV